MAFIINFYSTSKVVKNVFPVHYYGPVLASNDSGLAIKALVLTHEGITVESV
jgi:hypothetical protein